MRHAAEVLLHELQRLRAVEVADDGQRRVLGHVVGPVELAHVLDRRRLEIGHAADGRVLVRMRRERVVEDDLVERRP